MDKRPRVRKLRAAELVVLVRIEVVREADGTYMAHMEKPSEHDGSHWGLASDPQITPMIALAQVMSTAYINKEIGP